MPWGEKASAVIEYPRPPELALEDCAEAMSLLGEIEDISQGGFHEGLGAPMSRVRGHFRYGLKRFGQKTRVHVFVVGFEAESPVTIGVESQGGDQFGTASKAGRDRFLEALKKFSDFSVVEMSP